MRFAEREGPIDPVRFCPGRAGREMRLHQFAKGVGSGSFLDQEVNFPGRVDSSHPDSLDVDLDVERTFVHPRMADRVRQGDAAAHMCERRIDVDVFSQPDTDAPSDFLAANQLTQ